MIKKWLAVGTGLDYPGDITKIKLAIFRVMENKRAYPLLVKPRDLKLDDLLFVETEGKSDYCALEDFHIDKNGNIDYWVFRDSGIAVHKQRAMMQMTQVLLSKEFNDVKNDGDTFLISIKQKTGPNNA